MIKPFDSKELVARVKAVLRRYQAVPAPSVPTESHQGKYVEYPDLVVNLTNYSVTYRGRSVEMPPKELELLYFLASSPNPVSYTHLKTDGSIASVETLTIARPATLSFCFIFPFLV